MRGDALSVTASASQLHRAQLVSALGAVVLGIGLGLLLSRYLRDLTLPILLAGVAVHGWGMYHARRLERGKEPPIWWVEALYWLCWVLLVVAVGVARFAL